jgi:hypothetical protein
MPKPKKTRFIVISPDGLPIAPTTYPTRQAAEDALTDWCRRFEPQGYYAAVSERIPLAELPARCEIKEA